MFSGVGGMGLRRKVQGQGFLLPPGHQRVQATMECFLGLPLDLPGVAAGFCPEAVCSTVSGHGAVAPRTGAWQGSPAHIGDVNGTPWRQGHAQLLPQLFGFEE